MTDSGAHALWIILALVLVGSGLLARRMPFAKIITWTLAWVVLFLGVYLLFQAFGPAIVKFQQSQRGGTVSSVTTSVPRGDRATATGASVTSGGAVSVPMSSDGHFWVDAMVNGQTVRFLIDSGASITAMSERSAADVGLPPDIMNAQVMMQTANGKVQARRSVIATMQIGTIQAADLPIVVSPSFGNINVLGMNFLSKLKAWRVEDGEMILDAR